MKNAKKLMHGIIVLTMLFLTFGACVQPVETVEIDYREYVETHLLGNELALPRTTAEIHEVLSLDYELNEESGVITGNAVCRTLPDLPRSTIKSHYFFNFEMPYNANTDEANDALITSNIASVIYLDQFDNQ